MGSLGANKNTSPAFSYDEFGENHTKNEIEQEFTKRTGIVVANNVKEQLSKRAFLQLCKNVDDLQEAFKKDFGFTPINQINSFNNRISGYAAAEWYKGTETFGMQISPGAVNNDVSFIREAVAHEFGHLAVAYLAYHTLDYASARKELRYDDASAKSLDKPHDERYARNYRNWNTPFAKELLTTALKDNQTYKYHLDRTKIPGTTSGYSNPEHYAIHQTMRDTISKYATASYHEGIAESIAREYTKYGNEVSKAVHKELKKRLKKLNKKS